MVSPNNYTDFTSFTVQSRIDMSAVVLLSGGQDSTTCLFWAKARWPHLHALSVDYGQRHRAELDAARQIAALAGVVSHKIVGLPALAELGGSALVEAGDISAASRHVDRGVELPASFVPGRNALLLCLAAAYAAQVGAHDIVCGACETDFSGYPDCRMGFIDAIQPALALMLPESARPIRVHVPLMYMDKAAEVRLAQELPGCMEALALSLTCYEGRRPGCTVCPACKLRARGFAEAGITDPAA